MTTATATDDLTPRRQSYQLRADERLQRVDVTLSPGAVGYPTHADEIIYLALLQLSVANNEFETLQCKRTQVFDLLGWSTDSGSSYDRFREALERLAGLLITVRSELVSRNGKPYSRRDSGVHLIDSYHIGRGRDAECRIRWGELVREASALGDLKRLDWNLVLSLDSPLASQLYRLLDRVSLSGTTIWKVGWRTLASALGMSVEAYARPARFRQVLEPHLEALKKNSVIDRVEYQRGGEFTFHLRNYLRSELRRALVEKGVYEEAARQLVAGYDEVDIIAQYDCLGFRRGAVESEGGYLTAAIRESYERRYPDDEADAFIALWESLFPAERQQLHAAALKVCGVGDELFATRPDPTAWPVEMRAVVRFMLRQCLDAAQI